MSINLSVPQHQYSPKPRITVIGVGGGGCNAVNNMISSQLAGIEFVVANTDVQALEQSLADRRIVLGRQTTGGLGVGARPEHGRAAAEEATDELMEILEGTHMVFIAAGMGGGTGTGAAPVIARLARENGILTVGVVTKPFAFEGPTRMQIGENGIAEMQQYVDTLIVIPNQHLFRVATEKTTCAEAFSMADEVLHSGVRGVTDLMLVPGLINLDFADIRTVMGEMGKAVMGTGEAEGENRAEEAAEAAISNPLLEDTSMKGARGVLINITGGSDMTLYEVDKAASRIGQEVDPEATIIFGSTIDETFDGRMRVSVVATGIDVDLVEARPRPALKVLPDPDEQSAEAQHAFVAAAQDPAPAVRPETAAAFAARPDAQPVAEVADAPPKTAASPERAVSSVVANERPAPVAERPQTTAAASPSAHPAAPRVGRDDAFLPPPPVDPRAKSPGNPEPIDEDGSKRRRNAGLFSRVTGAGRQAEPEARSEPKPVQQPQPEPTLSEVEQEENLLEIPAFLRRQAN